jgi:hypothetical protein
MVPGRNLELIFVAISVAFQPSMDRDQRTGTFYFWIGLIGIGATGAIVGSGLDNLWTLAYYNPPFGFEPHVVGRGHLLLVTLVALSSLFDLCGFGVIFAGGVLIVQRLRGRL